jgi:hypothetical protein
MQPDRTQIADSTIVRRRVAVLWLLGVLAVIQSSVLIVRLASQASAPQARDVPLHVGDTISMLRGTVASGASVEMPLAGVTESWTILLALHSECQWSDSVMALWRDWVYSHATLQAVALTRDSPGAASRYLANHGLDVQFIAVMTTASEPTIERALVARTPAVYLLDPAGVLRFSGIGAEILLVDSIIRSARVTNVDA